MYEPIAVRLFARCTECGNRKEVSPEDMHGECAEKSIARSAEIFEIYRNGGRIEGLFDGVGPP